MLRHVLLPLAALALPIALAASARAQTTWYVDALGAAPGAGTQGDPFTSIQFAIDQPATVDGDTVLVRAGTYAESVDLRGKELRLEGELIGFGSTIEAPSGTSCLRFPPGQPLGTTIAGLRLVGGSGTPLGGRSVGGGAIVEGGAVAFLGVDFSANQASEGGGAAVLGGATATFDFCTFTSNEALDGSGGALFVDGATVSVEGGRFDANSAAASTFGAAEGGAIEVRGGGLVDLLNVQLGGNWTRGAGRGGALHVAADALGGRAIGCTFELNYPGDGGFAGSGAAVAADGLFRASDCTFRSNGSPARLDATFRGGASVGGEFEDCIFVGNGAQLGGALSGASALRCDFIRNAGCADGSGRGGAAIDSDLVECTLEANWVCGEGGGAYASTLQACDVRFNRALAADGSLPGFGGGLALCDSDDTTIRGNIALPFAFGPSLESIGGGVAGGTHTKAVISGNRADRGGGAALAIGGLVLTRSTVFANTATLAGAGVDGGTLDSTVVWHNSGPGGVGAATAVYSNLEGAGASGTNIDADPLLRGPAGSDAGLLLGSPCIDAGNPALALDPDGSVADMGAREFEAGPLAAGTFCRPTRYLDAGTECLPRIAAIGALSLSSPTPFAVQASGVRGGQAGLLVMGVDPRDFVLPSGTLAPGGTLCVGGFTVRSPVQVAAGDPLTPCSGTMTETVPASLLASLGLLPGDRIYAQYWFRATSTTLGLTDGVEIPIVP